MYSSRNIPASRGGSVQEHIESENVLKPEQCNSRRCAIRRAYRIGECTQAGTIRSRGLRDFRSISNRRMYSSRNFPPIAPSRPAEHIESENVLKPEPSVPWTLNGWGAYRIGECTQAGTGTCTTTSFTGSISNRRMYSSRNYRAQRPTFVREHIESENVLKPERLRRNRRGTARAYRIGECTQAGTKTPARTEQWSSISNRRMYSSRNVAVTAAILSSEHIESENVLKPELHATSAARECRAYRIGECTQAGTLVLRYCIPWWSISNRRMYSSRNGFGERNMRVKEHIESENVLKPELMMRTGQWPKGAYRIGECTQAGTG